MNKLLCFSLLISSLNAVNVENDIERDYIFPKWKEFNKINKKILHSHAHNAFVDIYLNNIAKKAYIHEHEKFPRNSIIIKPLYRETSREHLARLVVMVKMHKGYDSKHNDWWYGVYDKTGTIAWHQGKIASCIRCHTIAKKTDYLFTQSVNEKIEFQD